MRAYRRRTDGAAKWRPECVNVGDNAVSSAPFTDEEVSPGFRMALTSVDGTPWGAWVRNVDARTEAAADQGVAVGRVASGGAWEEVAFLEAAYASDATLAAQGEGALLAFVLMTCVLYALCELVPKSLFRQFPTRLSVAMADLLLRRFPNEREGELARRHGSLVRAGALVEVAEAIGAPEAIGVGGMAAVYAAKHRNGARYLSTRDCTLGSIATAESKRMGAPDQLARRFKGNGYLSNVIGNPLETTIALSHLIFEGTLDRFPGLRICAAHAGGYLPSYSGRSDALCGRGGGGDCTSLRKKPSEYFRKELFADTMVFHEEGLRHLVAEMGVGQLMYGTDYPYDWPVGVDFVLNAPFLSDRDKEAILGGNLVTHLRISA